MNKIENKKGCHPERFLFRISSLLKNNIKAGGPGQKRFTTTPCAGFTLIELLVVVLIIGILSAIALPQYEKAVKRSRGAQIITVTRSLADAANRYYLANGSYTGMTVNSLDIQIPSVKLKSTQTLSPAIDGDELTASKAVVCMSHIPYCGNTGDVPTLVYVLKDGAIDWVGCDEKTQCNAYYGDSAYDYGYSSGDKVDKDNM